MGGWGETKGPQGAGTTGQQEDAHAALDAVGIPPGLLALRAMAAAGRLDLLAELQADLAAERATAEQLLAVLAGCAQLAYNLAVADGPTQQAHAAAWLQTPQVGDWVVELTTAGQWPLRQRVGRLVGTWCRWWRAADGSRWWDLPAERRSYEHVWQLQLVDGTCTEWATPYRADGMPLAGVVACLLVRVPANYLAALWPHCQVCGAYGAHTATCPTQPEETPC